MPLDITTLESWLWDAACAIRGPVDAPKFKDYILPLVFLKRLSDVFEDEIDRLAEEYGQRKTALSLVEAERDQGIIAGGRGSVRFYIPEEARWESIRRHGQIGLGQYLTDAVRAVPGRILACKASSIWSISTPLLPGSASCPMNILLN